MPPYHLVSLQLCRRLSSAHKSVVKCPLPDLARTCDLIRGAGILHHDPHTAAQLSSLVDKFQNSKVSGELQQLLSKRISATEHWLFDDWLAGYLDYRVPVVINSNPGVRLPLQKFQSDDEWLQHAAKIVLGVVAYKDMCLAGSLPQNFFPDGSPMCMHQYYSMLNNCRIPNMPADDLVRKRSTYDSGAQQSHICVAYRNGFYRVELDVPPEVRYQHVFQQLSTIVKCANSEPQEVFPMGLLTSLPRDRWSSLYSILKEDERNRINFQTMFHSTFLLNLDDEAGIRGVPDEETEFGVSHRSDATANAFTVLHGLSRPDADFGLQNGANRWFDKTIQINISRDGAQGLNFEHTPMDGPAVAALVESVMSCCSSPAPQSAQPDYSAAKGPQMLTWNVPKELHSARDEAAESLLALASSMEGQCSTFTDFGKAAVKHLRVSPDAFVQVALQLAYSRRHGELSPPPTYESGSFRKFHLGRTGCIRSCSAQTVAFNNAMRTDNASATTERKRAALLDALRQHKTHTEKVMNGESFDRHMLALRSLARENGLFSGPVKQLLGSDEFSELSNFRLSTSQISLAFDLSVLFGPVIPDGYGFCYNILNDSVHMSCSSFKESTKTGTPKKLIEEVGAAMKEMRDLLR